MAAAENPHTPAPRSWPASAARAALIGNANGLTVSPSFGHVFSAVEDWTKLSQRALLIPAGWRANTALADISPVFKPNGTLNPGGDEYNRHVAQNFVNWRLKVDGMVSQPSVAVDGRHLRRLPAAPRSPSMIASKAGPPSACGPAFSSA